MFVLGVIHCFFICYPLQLSVHYCHCPNLVITDVECSLEFFFFFLPFLGLHGLCVSHAKRLGSELMDLFFGFEIGTEFGKRIRYIYYIN